jgi:phenylacetate-CoA ligase
VSQGIRRPFQAIDHDEICRLYPPAPEYYDTAWFDPPEVVARKQFNRLRIRADAARKVPFYATRWEEAKFDPDELKTLDDLARAPTYSVEDLRRSIESNPPLGDYHSLRLEDACREPLRLFMTGGTTGTPRPILFTQWDREVGSLLVARCLYMQGVRPGDVVLNSWLFSTHNGGDIFDKALHTWLNCTVITTSAGTVTSSERQVEIARAYGANMITTTGDYMLRLAEVAQELGYDPRQDLSIRALPAMREYREPLESIFGLKQFDVYGFSEVQSVAVECPAHDGLHIFEDAVLIQIVDVETGEPLPDGELGEIVITDLYKTGDCHFRFNTHDLSYMYPPATCECGSSLRRIANFAGRADTMVKLRGVNVWPEAVGAIATAVDGTTADYFVTAVRRSHRDELICSVESDRTENHFPAIRDAIAKRLKDQLGVVIDVRVVPLGSLEEDMLQTTNGPAMKRKRFRDDRHGASL